MGIFNIAAMLAHTHTETAPLVSIYPKETGMHVL